MKLLVEEGHADLGVQDRWKRTALDDARAANHNHVVKYLEHIQKHVSGA